jgi:hypothetical protein
MHKFHFPWEIVTIFHQIMVVFLNNSLSMQLIKHFICFSTFKRKCCMKGNLSLYLSLEWFKPYGNRLSLLKTDNIICKAVLGSLLMFSFLHMNQHIIQFSVIENESGNSIVSLFLLHSIAWHNLDNWWWVSDLLSEPTISYQRWNKV